FSHIFFLSVLWPSLPTLFPYTTLFRSRLGRLAAELGIVLISSLFEHRGPGLYHNTAAIHDADGSLLGLYRKSHIPQDPGFEEKLDRKSTRLNSSHVKISYAVFCLKKKI